MKMKYAVAAMVMMVGLAVSGSGCAKNNEMADVSNNSDAAASAYSVVDYRMLHLCPDGTGWICAMVEGPAADLVVVLVSPKGEQIFQTIDKKWMKTNFESVTLNMSKECLAQQGDWTLQVKTINPEKVVWGPKKINFYQAVNAFNAKMIAEKKMRDQ